MAKKKNDFDFDSLNTDLCSLLNRLYQSESLEELSSARHDVLVCLAALCYYLKCDISKKN